MLLTIAAEAGCWWASFCVDLVGALLSGPQATLARLIYVIVGLRAPWQLVPWARALSLYEARAEQAQTRAQLIPGSGQAIRLDEAAEIGLGRASADAAGGGATRRARHV